MKIRVGVTMHAAPEAVWRVVEPVERHVDWMADAESITFTSPTTRGVGTTFDCLTKVGPFRLVDKMEITDWQPERVMGIVHRGVVAGRGRFTLEQPSAGNTRFTWREELRFPWWMGGPVGAFVASPVLVAIWRRNLRRLQALVEGS